MPAIVYVKRKTITSIIMKKNIHNVIMEIIVFTVVLNMWLNATAKGWINNDNKAVNNTT